MWQRSVHDPETGPLWRSVAFGINATSNLRPLPPQVESDLCTPRGSALAFMLIVVTFIGTLMPLRLAYGAEVRMKREWLKASGLPVPPELPQTVVVQLGMLCIMAILSVLAARVLLLLPVLDPARCPPRWE